MEYYNYFHMGMVFEMAYKQSPTLENLGKLLADPFFKAIEIRNPGHLPQLEQQQLPGKLKTANVTVSYQTQPILLYEAGYNLNTADPKVRERTVARLEKEIDEAYRLNAVNISLCSGKYLEDESTEQQLNSLVETLTHLCEYAGKRGLDILLEPFDRDLDKKMFVGDLDLTLQVVEAMKPGAANFGILIDTARLPMFSQEPRHLLTALNESLRQVHIGNCVIHDKNHPAYGDRHPWFNIDGSGYSEKNLTEFLQALKETGIIYPGSDKIVSLEVQPVNGEDPDLLVANLKRAFLAAWARV